MAEPWDQEFAIDNISVYIAVSLDGYIADPGGGLDWLTDWPNPEGQDYGFADFMDGIDALVMGRITFETVVGFGTWIYEKPVFVWSNSLAEVPDKYRDRAAAIRGNATAVVEDLRGRGYGRLYVDGGRTIQSFLEADLIDEMTITRVPLLLGNGIPLFGNLGRRLLFEHRETRSYPTGLTQSLYRRIR